VGLWVRVSGLEIGSDATKLDVKISHSGNRERFVRLAATNRETYLEDDSGHRLYLKPPATDRQMSINSGDTLEGQLVFIGTVSPTARKLRLVFNDGNPGESHEPGLVIDLPLQGT
jgi:hypothetical protein